METALMHKTTNTGGPDHILTRHGCGHFRPAVNSPNPTQAWGHCRKRNKGKYGVAMACEALFYQKAEKEVFP